MRKQVLDNQYERILMALKRERFFALFFVILFLITSSAVTIAFIIANYEQSHQSSTNSATASSKSSNTPKLAGTKLQGFTPVANVSSLQIKDLVVGKGATVNKGATITVNYTGAVAATGIIFQSSLDTGQPVSFSLSQVIPGWTLGIPGMKVGGTRQLLIPASLAYGANPPPGSGIPANAPLVFDVTLISISKN